MSKLKTITITSNDENDKNKEIIVCLNTTAFYFLDSH